MHAHVIIALPSLVHVAIDLKLVYWYFSCGIKNATFRPLIMSTIQEFASKYNIDIHVYMHIHVYMYT